MPPPHSPPSRAAASSLPPEPHYHSLPPYPLIYHSTSSPQLHKVHSTLSPVPLKHSFVYILYAASTQPSEPRCRLLTASEPHYHPLPPYPLIYHSTPSPQLRKVHSTLSPVPLKHSFVYILYAASTQPSKPRCRLFTASEPHYHPLPPPPPILSSTTPLPLLSYVRCTPLSPVPLKHSFCVYAASTQPSEPRCRLLTASEPHYHHPLPPPPPILSSTTPLPLLSYVRCTPLSLLYH